MTPEQVLIIFCICDGHASVRSIQAVDVRALIWPMKTIKQTDKNISLLFSLWFAFSMFLVVVFHFLTDISFMLAAVAVGTFRVFYAPRRWIVCVCTHDAEMMDRKNMILLLFHSRTVSDLFFIFSPSSPSCNVVRCCVHMNVRTVIFFIFFGVLHTQWPDRMNY